MVFIRDDGQHSRGQCRVPVSTRFALHQDELNVVLYHGIGFIRFPQEARTIAGGLKRGMNCCIFEKRQFAGISPDEAVRRRDLPDCRFYLPEAILAA